MNDDRQLSIEQAVRRKDWAAVSELWLSLQGDCPDDPVPHVGRGVALREGGKLEEAEAAFLRGLVLFPDHQLLTYELGWVHVHRKDRESAEIHWKNYVGGFSADARGFIGLAKARELSGDLKLVGAAISDGLRKHPHDRFLLAEHARLAFLSGEPMESLRRWGQFRKLYRDDERGWLVPADVMASMGLFDEAEAWFEKAQRELPASHGALAGNARLAYQRGDFRIAAERWHLLIERQPTDETAYLEHARSLLMLSEPERGETSLLDGIDKAARNERLRVELAKFAEYRSAWDVAVTRWRDYLHTSPSDPAGYAGLARCLREVGNLEEAERVINGGFARFPGDQDVLAQYAWVCNDKREWPEALRRWTIAISKFPSSTIILEGLGQARWQAQLQEGGMDVQSGIAAPIEVGSVEDQKSMELLSRFESLGSNCEFGLVQRRYGCEPLGLLRWAFIGDQTLIDLLENDFPGLGDPEQTATRIANNGEYMVVDRRFGLNLHTYQQVGKVDVERLLKEQRRRIAFLARKLRSDLEDGEKIFLFKTNKGGKDTDAERVFGAMQRFGPARLLLVSENESLFGRSSVSLIRPGLAVASLSQCQPVVIHGTERWNIRFSEWLEICEQAAAYMC